MHVDWQVPILVEEKGKADKLITDLFDRYDVDRSGTLNTKEELRMITINLCFKLGLPVTMNDIEEEVETLWEFDAEDEEPCMSIEDYQEWFSSVQPKFKLLGEQR